MPAMSAYAGAKAALDGFTKVAAKEAAALGIRINLVSPGFIKTAAFDKAGGPDSPALKRYLWVGRQVSRMILLAPCCHPRRPILPVPLWLWMVE